MESEKHYAYDVALSYASEDRAYAEALASILLRNDVKVFYDQYEVSTLWGKNLYSYLSDLYQNKARYCVIFLSQHYATKRWTKHELEFAQARAFINEHEDYILPIRLDQAEIPGFLPTIAYLSWVEGKAESIAESIMKKLRKNPPSPLDRVKEQFWKSFTSQVLRLSLMLILDDHYDTIALLILPLRKQLDITNVSTLQDLPDVGMSLIGWKGSNDSFQMFLDPAPRFEFPTDFRIHPLLAQGENESKDNTLIVIERKARGLNLSKVLVETIRRLLTPLYQEAQKWLSYSNSGNYNFFSTIDFGTNPIDLSDILNEMADMVIRLGGQTPDGSYHWHFCCILLPTDPQLPHQHQNLIVRAQSKQSPYQTGYTVVSSKNPGLSLKAYQSGNISYRPVIVGRDPTIAYEQEKTTRSIISIPISGEDGISVAVLYIVSQEENAFSEGDQRILRVIGRMVLELLMSDSVQQRVAGRLSDMIENPSIVDPSFRTFFSEDDFINDLEALLTEIQLRNMTQQESEEVLSFIAIDIDNLFRIAGMYGDRAARNLSREVGKRIQMSLMLFSNIVYRRVYHVSASEYYLILQGVTLDEARNRAEFLRQELEGEYRFSSRYFDWGTPILSEYMFQIPDVTVRLGVSSYSYEKLLDIFQRFNPDTAIGVVRTLIMRNFDSMLQRGQEQGGNILISWDPDIWGFRRWTPS
jgi:GGDEF domain-containing protein